MKKKTLMSMVAIITAISILAFIPKNNASKAKSSGSMTYFAVCGKCGWVSPRVKTVSDASSMRQDHGRGRDHTCCVSTIEFDSEKNSKYAAYCSKCSYYSPNTTSVSDASTMRQDHGRGMDHTCCTSVIDVD